MFERFEQNQPPVSENKEKRESFSQEMADFYHRASCAMKNIIMELQAEIQRKSFGPDKDEEAIRLCQEKKKAIEAGLDLIVSRRRKAMGV